MNKPRRLQRGDTVAIVAPAEPVPRQLLDSAIPILEAWGVSVRLYDTVFSQHGTIGYLADTDFRRAQDFQEAWLDTDIGAIIAARGGYGTMRMVDLVDWPALRAHGAKAFAGSSDITALHQAIGVHLRQPTLFSPMPATKHFGCEAAHHLWCSLFEPESVQTLGCPNTEMLVPGSASGITVGGNLALVAAAVGTATEWRPPRGSIAVLEDVSEPAYRIDRMLTQLLRAGWFEGVSGIAFGSLADCGDLVGLRRLIVDRLGPLDVPIVWELGFGHIPDGFTVPLGVEATLDADAATLTLLEPALT